MRYEKLVDLLRLAIAMSATAEGLSLDEIAWIDAYHARVLAEVGPAVGQPAGGWLRAACAALGG